MKVKTIEQTISVNATAEKVWTVLWDKDQYTKWSAVFMPGSHYSGTIKRGERVRFLDPNNHGMESTIDSLIENREIIFHHLYELESGNKGRDLGNMYETYSLDEQNGVTILSLRSDMPEEYCSEMEAATKKAVHLIKELAEV